VEQKGRSEERPRIQASIVSALAPPASSGANDQVGRFSGLSDHRGGYYLGLSLDLSDAKADKPEL
jgi:hypothetical protein